MREGVPGDTRRPRREGTEFGAHARAEAVLGSLDLPLLEEIFHEERRRSAVERKNLSVQVRDLQMPMALGNWDQLDKALGLNIDLIQKLATHAHIYEGRYGFNTILVSTFVHELTHASAYNSYVENGESMLRRLFSLLSKREILTTGYQRHLYEQLKEKEKFSFFNEAVTDVIAEEVFEEYKRRSGDELMRGEEFHPAYLPQKALLESFVLLIAQLSGVPKENVWQAVKQGYFSGLDLDDSELGNVYADLSLVTIMNGLGEVKDEIEIPTLMEQTLVRINPHEVPEESRKKIISGVRALGLRF